MQLCHKPLSTAVEEFLRIPSAQLHILSPHTHTSTKPAAVVHTADTAPRRHSYSPPFLLPLLQLYSPPPPGRRAGALGFEPITREESGSSYEQAAEADAPRGQPP